MNKRKPDDEFARINLSYIKANRQEKIVFCPESRRASATLEPMRRRLSKEEEERRPGAETVAVTRSVEPKQPAGDEAQVEETAAQEVEEKHFTIMYGDTGHTYDSIIGPYLERAKSVTIEDPYIRAGRYP